MRQVPWGEAGFVGTAIFWNSCARLVVVSTTKGGTKPMANEHIPNDPYRAGLGAGPSDDNLDRPQRFNEDLQIDPELQEGPASTSKVALFAVGIAIVLGAVFYGLNNTSVKEAQTAPPAQTAP